MWIFFVLALLAAGPLSVFHSLAQTPRPADFPSITLGLVSAVHQREIATRFQPFSEYVARRIFPDKNARGRVLVASTLPELAKLLGEKKVDFFMESPFPTYVINHVHEAGAVLLRRWKGGKSEYRSLIAAQRDAGIDRLQDLRGKIIAFEDPESTSGYFLPKLFLQRSGFKLVEAAGPSAAVAQTEVGYVFAKDQQTLIEWILGKRVAAGALSDDDYESLEETRKSRLNVLAQTELLPRHLVSVRKDLPAEMTERLNRVLRAMHENPEGQKILAQTDGTTKFDLLPGGEEAMRRRLLDTFQRR
jgi:phosphonate transport system substrate-binding protein